MFNRSPKMGWMAVVAACTAAAALCVAPVSNAKTDTSDGSIVEQRSCELPFASYEDWLTFIRDRHAASNVAWDESSFRVDKPAASFEALRKGAIECWRLVYRSDGLKVVAYVVQPHHGESQSLPAIIFNRGGNRDFGRLVFADLVDFARWADQGFVIIASQYRGSSGSEGRDEFGGADVDDVLNLFPIARQFGADMENIFMAGFSRGGLMTYLAISRGAKVNAAAVIGAPTDLSLEADARPEMQELYRELMPDFERRQRELLLARRVLDFADKLDAPLLILHGGADRRVPATQALALAQQLERAHRPYELVIYAQDDHALSQHTDDWRRRLIAWFRQHMK